MSERKLKITLKTSTTDFDGIVSVDDLVPLLSQHVLSISEMSDAIAFLNPAEMGQGTYEGSGWSFSFTAVTPEVD